MNIAFSIIPHQLNRTTEYLACYGRDNLDTFAVASNGCGNLQFYLDRDMGIAFPHPIMEFLPNLGHVEVVNGTPPGPEPSDFEINEENMIFDIEDIEHELAINQIVEGVPLDCDHDLKVMHPSSFYAHLSVEVNINFIIDPVDFSATVEERQFRNSKGKEKPLANYSFNNDGLLTQEATRILDEGVLIPFSKVFERPIIDLEMEISLGVFAKDLLESAVTGNLEQMLAKIAPTEFTSGLGAIKLSEQLALKHVSSALDPMVTGDLMDVEQVLLEMAWFDEFQRGIQGPATCA